MVDDDVRKNPHRRLALSESPQGRTAVLELASINGLRVIGIDSLAVVLDVHIERSKVSADPQADPPMCRLLGVAPSGDYNWLQQPVSNRKQEDARLLRLIRASFIASHGIYGAPCVFLDLREAGETCSKHRVARLMREAKLQALHGYRTRSWAVGKPSVLIPNLLQRLFTATRPNTAWVTDITYIRTWQGWLYLAVVMDLFSRMIVGWAAAPTIHRELVLNAPCVGDDHTAP